jgi:hypothetical protein
MFNFTDTLVSIGSERAELTSRFCPITLGQDW